MSGGGPSDWTFNMDGSTGELHLNQWDSPYSTTGTLQLDTGSQYAINLSVSDFQLTITALPALEGDTLNFSGFFGGGFRGDPTIMAGSFAPQNDPTTSRAWYAQMERTCTVTAADGLNARAAATTQSAIINRFSPGTVLSFFEVVTGESVAGNPRWGHSDQGYYFWLGGTDHSDA